MKPIKNLLLRLSSVSFSRLKLCVEQVKKESGRRGIAIFIDMLWCYVRYGMGYFDYLTFGFTHLVSAQRRSFMSMKRNLAYVRRLNNPAFRRLFDDKLQFNALFNDYLKRDYIDLHSADLGAFCAFFKAKEVVFAKPVSGYGGKGIERLVYKDTHDLAALYDRLSLQGLYCVEEALVQHSAMNALSQSSINSLRITTLLCHGDVHILYALVRMSDGVKVVDNISSGGMYCPIDGDGVITAEAYCDKTGEYYENHPATGVRFKGFNIPFFDEAKALVQKAATVVPEIRYVGWDVAICEGGPALIEGNVIPGYDMCQNYRHLGPEKIGILPRFEAIIQSSAKKPHEETNTAGAAKVF